MSLCQITAIVLTLGLVFTSGIAPTLDLAYAHDFETIREYGVIRKDPVYDTVETKNPDGSVTVTKTFKGTVDVHGYYDKTVPVGAHKHWYDYAISVASIAVAAAPIVISLLADD